MKRNFRLMPLGKYLLALAFVWVSLPMLGVNLTGRITCCGRGVKGVVVSDGKLLVTTNSEGNYEMESDKLNGYVFYVLPRGYEPEGGQGVVPSFWAPLWSTDTKVTEQHCFRLRKVKNDKHVMIFGADAHLANRLNDKNDFAQYFVGSLRREKAQSAGRPVYTMLLGDLSWDNYWYSNQFNLNDFLAVLKAKGYPALLWPVMGNHDHDPAVLEGKQTDFLSSSPWRKIMSPNFYSFNLGKVHYVVLDDIYYKNENTNKKYSLGVKGSRNYDGCITAEQLAWLRKDLSYVKNPNTPIVIGVHIPAFHLRKGTYETYGTLARHSTDSLCNVLKGFRNVHIVSGHTHINYFCHPTDYPNVTEHNTAAVCATWWQTTAASGRHICLDGTPGGYSRWTIDGRKIKWRYCSTETGYNSDFRVYDMNTVKQRYLTDPTFLAMMKQYPNRVDYGKVPNNQVMVNAFAYDTDWKVEIFEGGRQLNVTRVQTEDPLHTLSYDAPKFAQNGQYGPGSASNRTSHMFTAQATTATMPLKVRVTDSFGRVSEQTIMRPLAYSLEMDRK